MVATHGSKARAFLSGYDITGVMQQAGVAQSAGVAESSVWGMTSKRYTPSDIKDATMNGSGVWEHTGATPGSIDDLLHTKLGGSHVATWLPVGDGLGNRARAIGGIETAFGITADLESVVAFEFELASEVGFLHQGRVLRALGGANSITTTANGTSVDDLGAAGTTTKGAAGALHVTQKGGGAGTITVKIQHSADNSVWNDLITFTGRTASGLAEYLEVSGTVQRWLRAIWTVTGGTWDVHVVGGRK